MLLTLLEMWFGLVSVNRSSSWRMSIAVPCLLLIAKLAVHWTWAHQYPRLAGTAEDQHQGEKGANKNSGAAEKEVEKTKVRSR